MASTILISKSKALNLKKLSFLYLIFIVFFFFSTAGDFVSHFVPLTNTQELLNKGLEEQFNKYNPIMPDEVTIKEKAKNALAVIKQFQLAFNRYSGKEKIKGERLKEQKFSKKSLHPDEASEKLHNALSTFVLAFPSSYQGNLSADLGLKSENLHTVGPVKNQFFIETPNGAIGSILNHLETVVIMQTLKYFKQEIEDGGMIRVASSKDSTFLQGFKSAYYVGEKISFDFFSRDSTTPVITLNGVRMPARVKGRHFKVNWTPTKEGVYELEANIKEDYIRHALKVVKPSLRFLENEQEIAAFLSEPLTLTIDMNGLENIKNLQFTSKGANIESKKNQLIITPLYEGRFSVEMRSGNKVIDSRSMFAVKGKAPVVVLKDAAGQKTTFANAHCLESISPLWQVVNFNLVIVSPNGTQKELKSSTRFLRNEIRMQENNAPEGSTLLFNQIRLVNANGVSTTLGAPIFIGK